MDKRGRCCCVNGCSNYRTSHKLISFYRLPSKTERCATWVNSIGRPDLIEQLKIKGAEHLYNNNVVCSDHFLNKDFKNARILSHGLWPYAVPSVFKNCGPNINGEGTCPTESTSIKAENDCVDIEVKSEIFSSDEDEVEKLEEVKKDTELSSSGGLHGNKCDSSKLLPPSCTSNCRVDERKKLAPILPKQVSIAEASDTDNVSGAVSSSSSSSICPPQFRIIDGKEDAKLSVSPVVLLRKSDENVCTQNNIDAGVLKFHTPNILKNILLAGQRPANKRKMNVAAENKPPSLLQSSLKNTVKKKDRTKMLTSIRPAVTEFHMLDCTGTVKTIVKNGSNIVPSTIRKSIRKGVNNLVDDTGSDIKLLSQYLCRICGKYGKEHLVSLFSDICAENHVPEIINRYLPIKLLKNMSMLPNSICRSCVSCLIDWQNLVNKCLTTDKWLHEIFNVTYDEAESNNTGEKTASHNLKYKDIKTTESDKKSSNAHNTDLDHDYCTIVSSTIANDYNKIGEKSYRNDDDDGIINEDIELPASGHTCTSGGYSVADTAADKSSDSNINDIGYLKYRPTRLAAKKLKLSGTATDVSTGFNNSDKEKKYKLYSLSVADKSDAVVADNGNDLSQRCHDQLNDAKVIEMDSSNVTNLKSKIDDEDSNDTLSPPSQPLLSDVLASVGHSKNSNTSDCDNDKSTILASKDYIIPPKRVSSDRYITKQGYKVVITFLKGFKEGDSDDVENNIELNECCLTTEGLESINITVSKEEKSNYKLVRSFNKCRLSYSRLAIFTCEHCVFYQMTANELGKHMKLFHPDKPLICPICKHIFKEDYNLIIHLQVTSCGRLDSNESNGNFNDQHKNSVIKSDSSELSVTIKMPYREDREDLCNDNIKNCSTDTSPASESVLNITSLEQKQNSDNNRQKSVKLKKIQYEILIETWKPSTTCVSFEPGFVILDSLKFLSSKLADIIEKEMKKLLKMPILSQFDCIALKVMLTSKVGQVLRTAHVNEKTITIKSVPSTPGIEDSNTSIAKPLIRKFKKSMKTFQSVKKNQPYVNDSADLSMNLPKRGRPRKENKETYCDLCSIRFRSSKSFYRHRRISHINRKCRYCDKMFSLLFKLKRHEREHVKNNLLHCEICDVKFSTKESILKHNLMKHKIGDYEICEFCSKQFFTKSSLNTHKKNVHSDEQHLCSRCGQIYRSLGSLKNHILSSHIVQSNMVCRICNKTFKNRRRLNIHMGSHRQIRKTFQCEICGVTLYSQTGIKHHRQLHMPGPILFCQICGMGSKRFSRVTTHIKKVHWTCVNKPADEQFPCLVCGVMLDDIESLSQHMMFHSEDDMVKDVHGCDEGKVECQDCEKFLNDKKDLAMHKFFIHQDVPFKCCIDDCNIQFWSKAALDAHSKTTHGKVTYECRKCDAIFNSIKKKNVHLRRVHQINFIRKKNVNSKSVTCNICGKSFCNSLSLSKHFVGVHQHVNRLYICDICGKCYNVKHRLIRHIWWHNTVKPVEKISNENDFKIQKVNEDCCDTVTGVQKTDGVIVEDGEVVIDYNNVDDDLKNNIDNNNFDI